MSPRRRRSDKCMIVRFWDSVQPYWEITCTIAGAAVVAILWVYNVSGYDGRIAQTDARLAKVENDAATIKQDIAVIKEAVLYLKEDRKRQ